MTLETSPQPLAGKCAIISGAGRGIGREVALRLARDGSDIVVHYSGSEEGAAQTVRDVEALGRKAWKFQADLTNTDAILAMFTAIDAAGVPIDILVNSAGISGGSSLEHLDLDDARRMFEVNMFAPLTMASEVAKRIRENGRVINISSTLASFPMAGGGVYGAGKAALENFTQSWAKELGRKGVTVNTVIPGATSPGMAERTPEHYITMFEKASPFGRIGRAEEVASVIAFLASPEASWVSGAQIMANGAGNM